MSLQLQICLQSVQVATIACQAAPVLPSFGLLECPFCQALSNIRVSSLAAVAVEDSIAAKTCTRIAVSIKA